MIIVAGLSTDYEIKVRMLKNNSTGLERADIERVVGNQYKRLLWQQQDSKKAVSTSKGSTTTDRGAKSRRPRNRFMGNCFNCGRKGPRAEDGRSAKKKIETKKKCPRRQEGRR